MELAVSMMATPCKCKDKESETCNHFLPSLSKGSQHLCYLLRPVLLCVVNIVLCGLQTSCPCGGLYQKVA